MKKFFRVFVLICILSMVIYAWADAAGQPPKTNVSVPGANLSLMDWKTFIELRIEYARFCYADSFMVMVSSPPRLTVETKVDTLDNTKTEVDTVRTVNVISREWQHTEPTFNGFTQYLIRKFGG